MTKADSVKLYKVRKLISELSNKEGRGTELVSLYIPPKKAIHEAIANLREEWGTAGNIKSDTTRNHVQDALTRTMQRLKLYRTVPDTGLVIFAGALPTNGPGSEVVNVYEIVPPKPVINYLYACVAPDTRILMEDGGLETMEGLKGDWARKRVMSVDFSHREIKGSKVKRYFEVSAGDRRTYRLTAESGREVVATEDHPFYTPTGWKRLDQIRQDDLVCVLPLPDLSLRNERPSGVRAMEVILQESDLRKIAIPPKNMGLVVRRLEKLELLPLRYDNPMLPALSRLLGHIFSDGSLIRTTESRDGRPYDYFTVDCCVGRRADEDEILADVNTLGYKAPEGRERSYVMQVDGRRYSAVVRHLKLRSTALVTLLRALGAPVGKKVVNAPLLPRWLMKAPPRIKKEFLSTYLGGDGGAPKVSGRHIVTSPLIRFHRVEGRREEGLQLAGQLCKMFTELGIAVNGVDVARGYLRSDGLWTVEIRITLEHSERNVLAVCHGIGFRYCLKKSIFANRVGEYLRIKERLRERAERKMERAKALRLDGTRVEQIGELLAVSSMTAGKWSRGLVESPVVTSSMMQTFDAWSRTARNDLAQPLLWESVVSIESVQISDVRDLTVEQGSHAFFANGFMVHNCDDHFRVEYLKDMLKEDKVYGILSIDSSEAGLGILSGDSLEIVDVLTSGISGKTRKGGQCVSADTLVQLEDGRLVTISRIAPRSRITSYNFVDYSLGAYECANTFVRVPKDFFDVETTRPELSISATGEHRFFTISTTGEVSTLQASKLRPGDRVLVSRKLQEPTNPSLSTMFPANYAYHLTPEGRDILKKIRTEKRLSKKRVAQATGLHQTEISQLERGERDLIFEKLKASVRFLYGDVDEFTTKYAMAFRSLPEYFSLDLLQLLGYIAGDGNAWVNRISLYEERLQVARAYACLAGSALNLEHVPIKKVDNESRPKSFAKKPYFETRIYSKEFVDALRQFYPGLVSTKSREIPEQIHRLDNLYLARFLKGLFDAESNSRKRGRIGISMKSGLLIKQLQLLLLRFGIVSSYRNYVNRFGTLMHSLDISDYESLVTFQQEIGFTARDKAKRLKNGIKGRRPLSYHTAPVTGSWVDGIAKELGIKRKQFPGITNFFHDKRGISNRILGRIINTFEGVLAAERLSAGRSGERIQLLEDTVSQLTQIEKSGLIFATVKQARRVKNSRKMSFVDIELPSTRSFVGNGFVLHNSARRYERGREMEMTYYFHRVAEHATRVFIDSNKVTGMIVGGPGPTKEEFLKGDFLHYELQKKVLAVLDLGYSGREGVRELVERAGDILKDVRLVEEKRLVQKFLSEVNKQGGLAVYGLPRVVEALQKASADVVLVSDDLDMVRLEATCKKCGTLKTETVPASKKIHERQTMASIPCTKCGATEYDIVEKDVVDVLEEAAFQIGSKVEVISSGTEEGSMFKSFGGVAALLRYRA